MALRMRWADVHFLHWSVPPRRLRRRLPPGLDLDEPAGEAWVSAVALRVQGTRAGPLPLGDQDYAQANVRTYVRRGEASGIWLLSTVVSAHDAAAGASALGLPYEAGDVDVGPGWATGALRARWEEAAGPPGALGTFLAERRFLFAHAGASLLRVTARHAPWALAAADASAVGGRALPRWLRRRPPDAAHVAGPVVVDVLPPVRLP